MVDVDDDGDGTIGVWPRHRGSDWRCGLERSVTDVTRPLPRPIMTRCPPARHSRIEVAEGLLATMCGVASGTPPSDTVAAF